MPFGQYPSFRFFLRMSPRIACHYYKVRGNQFPKLECKFLLRTSLSFSRGCHVQKVLKRMSCPYLSYFHKDSYLSLSLIKTDSYLSFSYGAIPLLFMWSHSRGGCSQVSMFLSEWILSGEVRKVSIFFSEWDTTLQC